MCYSTTPKEYLPNGHMKELLPTVVLRHRKENLKKCSLTGLEIRDDFRFFTYPKDTLPDLSNYVMLAMDAPPLTKEDASYGLFVLDSTWKYAEKMANFVESSCGQLSCRSLPATFRTAYPRKQEDCSDPERGLASIEAIFIAYTILGRDTTGLLDLYYWSESFLEKNQGILRC